MTDAERRRRLAAEARAVAAALGLDRVALDELGRLLPLLATADPGSDEGPDADAEAEPTGVVRPALPADGLEPSDPARLGARHEALLDAGHRHARGVHYTPAAAAADLVAAALDGDDAGRDRPTGVCDPSCGGGAFLLAAAEHRRAGGAGAAAALRDVHGVDLDPLAVEVARTALVLWAAGAGVTGPALVEAAGGVVERVVVGDALAGPWPGEGHLGAVVGNPPFGGQLARDTARDPATAARARALLGGAAGYADTAGLFLVRAAGAVAPGGRVVLVQPRSLLGSRDAGAVRARLEELAVLDAVWFPEGRLFAAAVDVCAPVLTVAAALPAPPPTVPVPVRRGGASAAVALVGRDRLRAAGSWAPLAAAEAGVPAVALDAAAHLGGWARPTAGFRDEFYAVAPFVVDLAPADRPPPPEGPPALPAGHARLVTVGLVEPGRSVWGRRPTRQAGRRLGAPALDVVALRARAAEPDGDRRLAAWADARLRPKVVVATQTRVVEAAVDDDGTWWPSVPVVSVLLDPSVDDDEHRWLVAAALTAPPVTAWAAERSAGTALSAHAIKLSARQVAAVPLPVDHDAWAEGARRLRRVAVAPDDAARSEHLLAAGEALVAAHGLTGAAAADLLGWWAARAGLGAQPSGATLA